jgi:hypothetical protein
MAITVAILASHTDTANQTSYNDAESTQPAANSGLLLGVRAGKAGGGVVPASVSGYGATWSLVGSEIQGTGARLIVYKAYAGASPSASNFNVTAPSGGYTGCIFFVLELTEVDQTDFLIQSIFNKNSGGASSSVTLSALADATNNAEAGFTIIHVNSAITKDPTAGWSDNGAGGLGHNSPTSRMTAQWRIGEDLTVTSSWSGDEDWVAWACEIKAASSGEEDGAEAEVEVSAAGAGTPAISGAAATEVEVDATGAGSPATSGGQATDVEVDVEGAGTPAVSGASSASIEVTADGAGVPAASDGATATVGVSATGDGLVAASGGADTEVEVDVTGEGAALESGSDGAATEVEVSAAGVGVPAASGGADAVVQVAATAGAGAITVSDFAATVVNIEAVGDGNSGLAEADGAETEIEVSVAGAGTPAVLGAAAAIVTVGVTGDGLIHASGGATATVGVMAVGGGGIPPPESYSGPWVSSLTPATRGATVLLEEV